MAVTQQVPGKRGRNQKGSETDHVSIDSGDPGVLMFANCCQALAAAVPAGQTCTGAVAGQQNVCMVRCQNPALAGPFGGVVPVQMSQGATAGSAASNSTVAATTNTANNTATGSASDIAADNNGDDNVSPAEKLAELREDAQRKRQVRRQVSRIERDTAAAIAYRHGTRY